jgi:hypothetical protein
MKVNNFKNNVKDGKVVRSSEFDFESKDFSKEKIGPFESSTKCKSTLYSDNTDKLSNFCELMTNVGRIYSGLDELNQRFRFFLSKVERILSK